MKKFLFLIFLTTSVACAAQDSLYMLGPNSQRKEGVPGGTVTKHEWQSKLYNNFREYYVYIPAQYDVSKPAALMVFQDGHSYVNDSGDFRVPIVYDNLIHQKKLPVTICLFVNPGHNTKDYPQNRYASRNRADEYDVLDDRYATMLMDEIIPELKRKYNISNDPKMHGIGGLSSGAICAFTAAWEHPEYFSKVLSHIGSYTNIRGGNNYPSIIRKHKKKDIKIFMQDGTNDLDNEHGNWWLANLEMESAFKFKGYEFKFEKGTGTHSGKHGGSILPESLIWLWSDITNK
ncbi:alpha/beta hydrolase [Lacibacter sp.]|uniref:alpha/beta hydrolase n=1 Tax=Lacibacter sp. TaxID=1915409 RepID=UPI002B4ACB7D|nr:alpha/beta hydrolase-fold protein [Lacibacter sp.]HLP37568.1 alpha/beta hydrolase-fold protein [Lacibacter sp.]